MFNGNAIDTLQEFWVKGGYKHILGRSACKIDMRHVIGRFLRYAVWKFGVGWCKGTWINLETVFYFTHVS